METKRMSIIIPIHNSGQYLEKCVESILSQITPSDEIILVDDASTDNSLSLCYVFEDIYPESVRVIAKERQSGPSDSRNLGTRLSTGRFICYVDSDDWLAPNALNEMYTYAVSNNCDIVQSGFYYAYDGYLLFDKRLKKVFPYSQNISPKEAISHLIKDGLFYNFIWGKIYKSELARSFLFPVDVCMGEDLYWQHRVVDSASRIGILPNCFYYYRQNQQSISNNFSENHITLLFALEDRLSFVRENYMELYPEMLFSYWKQAYESMIIAKRNGDDTCWQIFNNYWKELNMKYQQDIAYTLKNNIEYKLFHRSESLLRMFLLIKRIMSRFYSNYHKITIKK